MGGAKRWCFTINNPRDTDYFWVDLHANPVLIDKEVQYLICQEERGEEGTLHIQGFVIFKQELRLTQLKRICARAHWEVCRGTNAQASDYCKKDDTYTGGYRFCFGELPAKPAAKKADERRQEAAEELDLIKQGYKRPHEVPSMTLLQCGFLPAYKELTADILGPYRPNLQIITMVGPPGTGKSYQIQKHFPGHGRCIYGNNGCWFQNPCADVMVFEEFAGSIPLQRMKELLDVYPMAVEIKGGMRPLMATTIIITSNTPPNLWYSITEANQDKRMYELRALYDRIGYSDGSYVPARSCGHYWECPQGISVLEARKWFSDMWEEYMSGREHISDDDDDFGSHQLVRSDARADLDALFHAAMEEQQD